MFELFKKCGKCHEEKSADEFNCKICKTCQFDLSKITEKKCNTCQQVKSIDNFTHSIINVDGYCYYCKECVKKDNKQKYSENPDLYIKRVVNWQKNNKDKYNQSKRKIRKKFRDAMVKVKDIPNLYFNSNNKKYYGFTIVKSKKKKKSLGIATLEEATVILKQWMIDIRKPSFHENQKSGQYFGGKPL